MSKTLIVDEFTSGVLTDAFAPNGRVALYEGQDLVWQIDNLPMTYDAALLPNGDCWVSLIRERALWRVDQSGTPLQKLPVGGYPCSLQLLPAGNVLVAGWDDDVPGFVREYRPDGQLIWELTDLRWPWKAQRLPDGQTLIADAGTNEVFAVDEAGQRVWCVAGLGPIEPALFDKLGPVYCQRLDDGHTLVSIRSLSRVVELDEAGAVVWEVPAGILATPYSATRLADGHTLVADNGHKRVVELDEAGQPVWELTGFGYIAKAYRLRTRQVAADSADLRD